MEKISRVRFNQAPRLSLVEQIATVTVYNAAIVSPPKHRRALQCKRHALAKPCLEREQEYFIDVQ